MNVSCHVRPELTSPPSIFRAGLAVLCALVSLPCAAAEYVLLVEAGKHDRQQTIVSAHVPKLKKNAASFELLDVSSKQAVPAQFCRSTKTLYWQLPTTLSAGSTARFELREKTSVATAKLLCADDGKSLTLSSNSQPILVYHTAIVESPPGIAGLYRRSGYIHPLHSPSGRVLTGDFCADHPHQHGMFFAWVNTKYDGRSLDFWNQRKQTAQIRHLKTIQTESGPVYAGFATELEHADISAPDKPLAILHETWAVRAFHVGDVYVVDFSSEQNCIAPQALELLKHHYGGMAFRGPTDWLNLKAKFLTSENKGRTDGNATQARWVDLRGKVKDRLAGLSVLSHVDNVRSPQYVRLHPNKPYFCFLPVTQQAYRIEPKQKHKSQFRVLLYDGDVNAERVEQQWHDYVEPPSVEVQQS